MEHHYRHVVLQKLEHLVLLMQHPDSGVNFRPQKLFLTSIPAAVSGGDLIEWISKHLQADTLIEANHITNMLLVYGYIYSLTDIHALNVENDTSVLYRFQAPYFWLSKVPKPDAMDYAIYLLKRNMRGRQKFRLEEYELVTLEKLEKILCDKWEFIYLQAEEQVRMGKERKKSDRMVIDSQEQAFWLLHRPPPGHPCLVEESVSRFHTLAQMQAKRRSGVPVTRSNAPPQQQQTNAGPVLLDMDDKKLDDQGGRSQGGPITATAKANALAIKSLENLLLFNCHHSAYDWFCDSSSDSHNLWTLPPQSTLFAMPQLVQQTSQHHLKTQRSQSSEFSDDSSPPSPGRGTSSVPEPVHTVDMVSELTSVKQLRLWATGFNYLLRDPAGRRQFEAFLLKEFSAENLRFYMAVHDYKFGPMEKLPEKAQSIFTEFLQHGAPSEINIDSKTKLITERELKNINRFTFEEAQEHIYNLMKNDSYVRYLRSEDYANALKLVVESQQAYMAGKLVTPSALPLSNTTADQSAIQKTKAGNRHTSLPRLMKTMTDLSLMNGETLDGKASRDANVDFARTPVKNNAVVPWEDEFPEQNSSL